MLLQQVQNEISDPPDSGGILPTSCPKGTTHHGIERAVDQRVSIDEEKSWLGSDLRHWKKIPEKETPRATGGAPGTEQSSDPDHLGRAQALIPPLKLELHFLPLR